MVFKSFKTTALKELKVDFICESLDTQKNELNIHEIRYKFIKR